VAVQVHKSGQHGQPTGIQDQILGVSQSSKPLTHGSDLALFGIQLHRTAGGIHCICQQHGNLPP